jgi:hypothetical protein
MARYQDAIEWIAYNDDTEFLADDEPMLSVSASLVADLWGKTKEQCIADIRRALERRERER